MTAARYFEQVCELDAADLGDFFETAGLASNRRAIAQDVRHVQWLAVERAAAAGDADAMRRVEKMAEARLGLA